jgi:hypothetical protein
MKTFDGYCKKSEQQNLTNFLVVILPYLYKFAGSFVVEASRRQAN